MNSLGSFVTADEALSNVCRAVLEIGSAASPRGMRTRELVGVTLSLSDPRARRILNPARRWSEALAVGELCWHLSASDSVEFISHYAKEWAKFSPDGRRIAASCYGRKIFGAGAGQLSQWDLVRMELERDPHSRRAVLILGDTGRELYPGSGDVSCLTSIQFLMRNGRLDCIAYMRSNDLIWGLCYDLYFVTMLQELLACRLGIELGSYTHIAGSMHVYEQFIPMAERIAASRPIGNSPMPPMRDIGALPAFLEIEQALRTNHPEAETRMAALPSYWRLLAEPLRLMRNRRYQRGEATIAG